MDRETLLRLLNIASGTRKFVLSLHGKAPETKKDFIFLWSYAEGKFNLTKRRSTLRYANTILWPNYPMPRITFYFEMGFLSLRMALSYNSRHEEPSHGTVLIH